MDLTGDELRRLLLATDDAILVEASPTDTLWESLSPRTIPMRGCLRAGVG